jgi:hypothetical protein
LITGGSAGLKDDCRTRARSNVEIAFHRRLYEYLRRSCILWRRSHILMQSPGDKPIVMLGNIFVGIPPAFFMVE